MGVEKTEVSQGTCPEGRKVEVVVRTLLAKGGGLKVGKGRQPARDEVGR